MGNKLLVKNIIKWFFEDGIGESLFQTQRYQERIRLLILKQEKNKKKIKKMANCKFERLDSIWDFRGSSLLNSIFNESQGNEIENETSNIFFIFVKFIFVT